MKRPRLTPKQERFVLNLVKGMSQRQAYIAAGYSAKSSPDVLDVRAYELAKDSRIQVRLAELQKRIEDESVMTELERRQRLSEIGRARLTDFLDSSGEPFLDKDSPNNGAVAEFMKRTRYTKDGDVVVERSIKLRDPVPAIQELRKYSAPVRAGYILRSPRDLLTVLQDALNDASALEDTQARARLMIALTDAIIDSFEKTDIEARLAALEGTLGEKKRLTGGTNEL